MENWFWCNFIVRYQIATKFCTCHDSTAVLSCAKFHSDHFITAWKRAEWTSHWIWITMEKSFIKRPPHIQVLAQWLINVNLRGLCQLGFVMFFFCWGVYINHTHIFKVGMIKCRRDIVSIKKSLSLELIHLLPLPQGRYHAVFLSDEPWDCTDIVDRHFAGNIKQSDDITHVLHSYFVYF